MPIEVSVKMDFMPFGTFRFQLTPPTEEDNEIKKLKEKLTWPYELPAHTGALRGPISLWSTSA